MVWSYVYLVVFSWKCAADLLNVVKVQKHLKDKKKVSVDPKYLNITQLITQLVLSCTTSCITILTKTKITFCRLVQMDIVLLTWTLTFTLISFIIVLMVFAEVLI